MVTLLTTIFLLLIMMFQDAGMAINEAVFQIFWAILSFFTGCNIQFPNMEEASFNSCVPAPEQDTVRHFSVILLLSRDKNGGFFIFWVAGFSFLSFYFSLSRQIQEDRYLFAQNITAFEYEEKMLIILPKVLFGISLLSSFMFTHSMTYSALLVLSMYVRTNTMFICVLDILRRHQLSKLYWYGQEIFLLLCILLNTCTLLIAVCVFNRDASLVPFIFLTTETMIYNFNVYAKLRELHIQKKVLLKNTKVCTSSDVKEDSECAICLLRLTSGRITPCRHIFHSKCLEISLQNSENCPICRTNIQVLR
ncbi:hypothetical protein FSP39_019706 [Pinctada imbricata]|uniref:RING-type domain-containing protein n=1 Tax=Pinctada imbricata TaxID=66713 RepID=A0AA88Y173_PINIB|nr:hypothetical protein FSP39_019706 [Pinctada imbricata]